ncbi:UNVERIFIED_CONTAM: hypothetical protein RKD50_008499 [Streptomyces canus]
MPRTLVRLEQAHTPWHPGPPGGSLTRAATSLGRPSNAAGPLIVAALYNWLVGAIVLAAFGPRTRPKRVVAERPRRESVAG